MSMINIDRAKNTVTETRGDVTITRPLLSLEHVAKDLRNAQLPHCFRGTTSGWHVMRGSILGSNDPVGVRWFAEADGERRTILDVIAALRAAGYTVSACDLADAVTVRLP